MRCGEVDDTDKIWLKGIWMVGGSVVLLVMLAGVGAVGICWLAKEAGVDSSPAKIRDIEKRLEKIEREIAR